MTDEEKENNPSHVTTGGYLKKKELTYHEQWARVWQKCTEEEKKYFTDLPNFDAEIFKEITGIDVTKDTSKIKVVANGKEVYISKESAKALGLMEDENE